MPGHYDKLYQYLQGRFANVVVLTFAQIEDLIGFMLPVSARVDQAWWANPGPNDETPSSHSRSWTLAMRIAIPNLRAQTVTFEREQHRIACATRSTSVRSRRHVCQTTSRPHSRSAPRRGRTAARRNHHSGFRQGKTAAGRVIAAGNGKVREDGERVALDVKAGDTILFGKYSGQEIKLDGIEYLIMKEDDVLAALEGVPAVRAVAATAVAVRRPAPKAAAKKTAIRKGR
jgi:co-chaperonin GroES (HSP10)